MGGLTDAERERLTSLHRRRYSDLEIASHLDGGWTRYRVWYWRRKLGLPPNGRNHRRPERERAAYMARRGWGHLIPGVEYIQLEGRKKAYKLLLAGHDLTRAQVDILCALRDGGPQTRDDLDAPRHVGPRDHLGKLIAEGLVERRLIRRGNRLVCLYGLTAAAGERWREKRIDGIDKRQDDPESYR